MVTGTTSLIGRFQMPDGQETNKQFQEREFPQRIENAKRHAKKTLGKFSNASDEEKEKARKVLKAVSRVEERMGITPAADSGGKQTEGKKRAARVADIAKLPGVFAGLPGEEKKRLKGIEEQTGKAAKGK
jgi:hypothetical protein